MGGGRHARGGGGHGYWATVLIGLATWVLVLAALALAARVGWLDASRTGDFLVVPAAALLGVGVYFDRTASEDAKPDTLVLIPFTMAGLRAGGPFYAAAVMTFAAASRLG